MSSVISTVDNQCPFCGKRCRLTAMSNALLVYYQCSESTIDDNAKGLMLLLKLEVERHLSYTKDLRTSRKEE